MSVFLRMRDSSSDEEDTARKRNRKQKQQQLPSSSERKQAASDLRSLAVRDGTSSRRKKKSKKQTGTVLETTSRIEVAPTSPDAEAVKKYERENQQQFETELQEPQHALRESILSAASGGEVVPSQAPEEAAPTSAKGKKSKRRRKRHRKGEAEEDSKPGVAASADDVDRMTREAFRKAREQEQMRETRYDLTVPPAASGGPAEKAVASSPPPGLVEDSNDRIRELEEENASLQQEIARLKEAQELEHSHSKRELVMQVLDLKESSSEMARMVSQLQEELQRLRTREHTLLQEVGERRPVEE